MSSSWVDLVVPEGAPDDTVVAVRAGEETLAGVRHGGGWKVFADRCTHADCAFTEFGEVEDGALVCNCHGAEFRLSDGAVLEYPAEVPIVLLELRVRGGRLQVSR